jgi:hypothetical protein
MKRKFYYSTKRKIDVVESVELVNYVELVKRIKLVLISKRKMQYIDSHCKKQKTCKCIVHEEKYICDIYECNGNINRDRFLLI